MNGPETPEEMHEQIEWERKLPTKMCNHVTPALDYQHVTVKIRQDRRLPR